MADGAVATAVLGGVEGLVGGAQQRGGGLAVHGIGGEAEADRDRDGVPGELVAQRAAKTLGEHKGAVLGGVGQDQGELLAAHARRRVDLPLALVQQARDALQGERPRPGGRSGR